MESSLDFYNLVGNAVVSNINDNTPMEIGKFRIDKITAVGNEHNLSSAPELTLISVAGIRS